VPDYSQAGKDYRRTVEFTREVLANLKQYHPEYDPAVGYDLAGFVWFQGWSDNNANHGPHYAQNMTNLINDLRRDLGSPTTRPP
jgi:alpha-galactosidase